MFALIIYVIWPALAFIASLFHNPMAFELRECATDTAFVAAYTAHCEAIDWADAIAKARTAQVAADPLVARLTTKGEREARTLAKLRAVALRPDVYGHGAGVSRL